MCARFELNTKFENLPKILKQDYPSGLENKYENQNLIRGYNEKDSLGGHDPYSSSKACCELITNSYRSSYFSKDNKSIGIATARAGNVIGGGDYSEYRLIPDLFKSIERLESVSILCKFLDPRPIIFTAFSILLWVSFEQ